MRLIDADELNKGFKDNPMGLAMTNDRPQDTNAIAWYEYGIKQGLKQKDPQSKWVLDEQKRIICRNCGYIAPYDFHRGYCCGSYCANCGSKMEEMERSRNDKRRTNKRRLGKRI